MRLLIMVHSFVLPDLSTCKRNTEKKNTLSSPCLYPSIVLFFLKKCNNKINKMQKEKAIQNDMYNCVYEMAL